MSDFNLYANRNVNLGNDVNNANNNIIVKR